MAIVRWIFDYGGTYFYIFERNPNRSGGDTGWAYEPRTNINTVIGSNVPNIQIDGFTGARRTVRFTAVTGTMKRVLQDFFLRRQIVYNCRDHLSNSFDCFIASFTAAYHPVYGDFPGSGEDTYDIEMSLIKMG